MTPKHKGASKRPLNDYCRSMHRMIDGSFEFYLQDSLLRCKERVSLYIHDIQAACFHGDCSHVGLSGLVPIPLFLSSSLCMLWITLLVLYEANTCGPLVVEFASVRLSVLPCQEGPLRGCLLEVQHLGSRRVLQRMATGCQSKWCIYIPTYRTHKMSRSTIRMR